MLTDFYSISNSSKLSLHLVGGVVCQITPILTLPLHYQILIIKSSSLIQLKNEIVLTFVV